MKAIVQDRYGGADALRLAERPAPTPGEGEVLVRVRAAGVDRGVWHLMTGLPLLVRVLGFGLRAPRQPVPGLDLAGVVEAVGAGVDRFAPGDEVFGVGTGALAELAVARADRLARMPSTLDFAGAAALPASGATALVALRRAGRIAPGARVLVIGASGGVGHLAVQLAVAAGAQVTGVCGAAKADLVRSLGADSVIDHAREEVDAHGPVHDVVIDLAGNRPLRRLRRALTPRGTLVIVGGEHGGRLLGGIGRNLRALALSPLVSQRLLAILVEPSRGDLEELARRVEAGELRPHVERAHPLEEAALALRDLEGGRVRGKRVLLPGGG